MEVYIKDLMDNDHPAYVQLTELSHLLHSSDLDIRQLGSLRRSFEVEENSAQVATVPCEVFSAKLESVFSPHRLGEQIISKILGFVVNSDEQKTVELLRVNNLIDFVLCHPTIVKKNKNTSAGMELVLQEQQPQPT